MGGHFSSGRGFRVPTSEFGFNSQKSESVRVSPTFEKRKRAARRPWRSPPFGGCPRPAGLETGDPKSVKSEWVRVGPTFEMQKTGRYPRMTRRKLMVPKAVLLRRCQAGRRLPLTRIFHSEVGQNHANPCSAGFQACRIQVSNLRAVALEKRIRTWLPLYFHRVIRVSFQIAMKYPG